MSAELKTRVFPTLVFLPGYGTVDTIGVSSDEEFWTRIQSHIDHVEGALKKDE